MWEEHNINWEVFTREEKDKIMQARRVGDLDALTSLVAMTPTKEIELQKIVDAMTPQADGFESKVRKEMEEHFKKKGINGPQLPAEEAQWEAKLQEEYSQWLSNKQDKEQKRLESLNRKKGDKPSEKKEVKADEPKEPKGLDYDSMKRKELVEIAEDNNVPTNGSKDDIIKRLKDLKK